MNGLINTVACASAFFSPMDVTVDLEMDDERRLSRTRSRDGVGQRSARARLMTERDCMLHHGHYCMYHDSRERDVPMPIAPIQVPQEEDAARSRSHSHPSAAHSGISVSNTPRLVVYRSACKNIYSLSGGGSGCSGK